MSGGDVGGGEMGDAGTPEPETEEGVKDYGPPADADEDADEDAEPDEGTSGADEGISPWAPEAYDPEGEGPTTSTES